MRGDGASTRPIRVPGMAGRWSVARSVALVLAFMLAVPATVLCTASAGHRQVAGASTGGQDSVASFGAPAAGVSSVPGPVVGIAAAPDGDGYWAVSSSGAVTPVGTAQAHGSLVGTALNQPVVGMAATPGSGYWLVAADGGIFAFGDAGFAGSMGGHPLNAPVVGMAATPGGGYWEVASDGGIFAFGDAGFFGSMGGRPLNQPIVGMAATPGGSGYWLVAADGGIFAFGDAGFFGSMGGRPLNQPIVGMAGTPGGSGYWLVAADGGIFAFGDAPFEGAGVGTAIDAPAVGVAAGRSGYWIAYGQTASAGTPLGQEQLLAILGYLPVSWNPLGFHWRWPGLPPQLTSLWSAGQYNQVLRGAIDAFEHKVGLDMDGQITQAETGALVAAVADPAGSANPDGYSYALAQEHAGTTIPESLTVWHDGSVVASTPANTGIPASPTAIGTFPVYLRLRNQVMTGTAPDGSHYADPVQFVAYFVGSDAIHFMPRSTYGYPQSLGCVEIPYQPASVVWNYTTYGTLVTVTTT
ncbi:MAG: L,D-transpeptidase [Acidimicrobiales bacterium]